MKILVAGGAGYIGTHSCVSLLLAGHEVVVVDSLVNSRAENIRRVEKISGRRVEFIECDLRKRKLLDTIFASHRPDAVINFAGHKAVGESVRQPLRYYDNNLNCALTLLESMRAHDVKLMVFSSSAAVYGEPAALPIREDADTSPQSPYGRTKLCIEQILKDLWQADESWKIAILRYFNPVGAHPSGLIGEQPNDEPGNLMPIIGKVAAGELKQLEIFGYDYDTSDGTAIRDYIHVMDLARGHEKAIKRLAALPRGELLTINLGTGKGYSVLEVLAAYQRTCGHKLPFRQASRRVGDVACCWADAAYAKQEIDWQAELDIDEMCRDAWNWQQKLAGRRRKIQ